MYGTIKKNKEPCEWETWDKLEEGKGGEMNE